MIVPSPGSTVSELIAGLPVPPPVDGGGSATVGAVVGAGAAGGGAGSLPHPASSTTSTSALRRTGEPRAPGRHLDRAEQVRQIERLGEGRLRMSHRRVHRAPAIVV